nr:tyrosine-type recombinase/integrase [Mycobacterium sp. 1164966.3]
MLLAATGLRRSELLALRWEDVDLDGRVLTVCSSVVRLKGQGLVRQDTTKGGGSRSVPLPRFAVDALHRRKGEQPGPNTAGVIFRPRQGRCATRTTSVSSGVRFAIRLAYRMFHLIASARRWRH